jgi:3-phosphoshikimate 1-carboxyvinyltransferase
LRYILTAPEKIDAEIVLPASKSISNRALIINALAESKTQPDNLSHCDDTDVMVAALRDMPYEINIKAAGTAMRFITALLAVSEGEHVITGTERMKHRPIKVLVDALRTLGADIEYVGEEGFPPLRIRGRRLRGGDVSIPGDVSSQYISALLMVGAHMTTGLTLHLMGELMSRPYIDMTLCTMQAYGAKAEWLDASTIEVQPLGYVPLPFVIENDWTASSYWYEMLALMNDGNSRVRLPGLMDGSRQGDSAVRYIFNMLGVKTTFDEKVMLKPTTVMLQNHPRHLPHFDFDFKNQPDLAQTVVVTTCLRDIPFRFTGLQTLRIKETDRIAALMTELKKLGYVLKTSDDGVLEWNGERCEPMQNPVIDTYEDHRMAMAFAPAAIKIPGLAINNPEVVSKSYPHFWDDLKKAGFKIVTLENHRRAPACG